MASLTVRLLGGFRARTESGHALTLPTRKTEALLAFLAINPGRSYPRDKLTALLWGDTSDDQARHSLRQALSSIRRSLASSGALVIDEERNIRLSPSGIEVDAVTFERDIREGTPESLDRAIALYQGDLLEGLVIDEAPFETWLLGERERLRELALDALAKRLGQHVRADAIAPAIQVAGRLLVLDSTQETVHRALMHLYARDERRGAALRQYQICVEVLKRELGAEPEIETRQVYQEILKSAPAIITQRYEPRARPRRDRRKATAAGVSTLEPPLIGREPELARLRGELSAAWHGRGHVVLLTGDAGIGKTRLVEELAGEGAGLGGRVLLGRCHKSEQVLPFRPWIDALRAEEAVFDPDALRAMTPAARRELARLAPELGETEPDALPAPENQARLFEAILELVAGLAARRPVMLILDDAHWADAMSLRLLGFLGRRVERRPVLLVVSAREEELLETAVFTDMIAELARDRKLSRLTVPPLSRDETAALVRATARARTGDARLGELTDRAWAVGEGNPFVVIETVQAIQEGQLTDAGDGPVVAHRVREVIAAGLERLSPVSSHLAAVAAVIGREFSFPLLQHAARVDDREAAEGMEELVRRRVLSAVGDRLEFTHRRVRDVVYDRVLAPVRPGLHAAVGEALETLYPDQLESLYDRLADHFSCADQPAKALTYLIALAETAARRYALDEAVRVLNQALDLAKRRGGRPADTARALELLGDLESLQGHVELANQAYDRAAEVFEDAASRQRIANKRHRPGAVTRNGARIAYYAHGSGEPTLFLMQPIFYGLGTYQPLLDLLCSEFRIITVDPRGVGGSDPIPPVYLLRDHAEDVRAVIEATGNRPVVFLGMSRAAALGVILATTYPHLVEKLVLIGPPPSPSETLDTPGVDKEFWKQVISMIKADDYERAMPLFWSREFSEPSSGDLIQAFVQASRTMPKEVFRTFFMVEDPARDIRPLLPTLRVPTLVLHGEEDRIVPVEAGRYVARHIPDAQFYAFKGRGHLPAFTAPVEFAQVVRNFVRTGRAV